MPRSAPTRLAPKARCLSAPAAGRSARGSFSSPWNGCAARWGCPTALRPTPCGIPSQPICSRAAAICAPSRNCLVTRHFQRRRSIPASTANGCWKSIATRIRAADTFPSHRLVRTCRFSAGACLLRDRRLSGNRAGTLLWQFILEGIMSAQEAMETSEHAKEAAGENRKIALLIAVIALCLALSETLGKGAQTESIAKNVEASNLWAFFQAKTIRRTTVQTAAEQAKLNLGAVSDDAAEAALQKQIDDWQKTAGRYRSEPETGEGSEQLAERAKHAEEERELATAKYHHFELASAAFQIGIVLASATIITGMIALAWISGLLAVAGIAFTALGVFMPHLLHLH